MSGYNNRLARFLCIASLSSLLAACSSNPTADLEDYVQTTKSQQKSSIEPLPEFKPYESFAYQAADLRDPFTAPSFSHVQPSSQIASSNNGISLTLHERQSRWKNSRSTVCAWSARWSSMRITGH